MRRPLLFAAVGVANTAVDFGVFLALTRMVGIEPVVASALGFLTGSAHSYVANGLLTFGDRGARLASTARVLRFAVVTALCLGVSVAAIAAALPLLPDIAAKGVSIFATFAAGYLLNGRFVYTVPGPGARPDPEVETPAPVPCATALATSATGGGSCAGTVDAVEPREAFVGDRRDGGRGG